MLLLNIWGNKKSSTSAESMREMQEVHKVMNIVKSMEPRYVDSHRISITRPNDELYRWYSSGRIWCASTYRVLDMAFDILRI